MKRYILLFVLLLSFSGYAQNTINNYKYILVPEKFSFLKETDQYGLNTLSKMIMEEKGFTVYFDNSTLPDEIANNKCNALNFDVLERNKMLSTNLTVVLKDCKGNIIFKSKEGKSKEKEYKVSYNLALRDAFTTFREMEYAYTAPASAPAQQAMTATAAPVQQAANAAPVPAQAAVSNTAVAASAAVTPAAAVAVSSAPVAGQLYAQPTATGYQLIDTTPKIILTLFKSSAEGYFIASNGTANGIVLKKGNDWFFEYYKGGKLLSEQLSIKF